MIDENISTIIFYYNERGIGDACMLKPTVEKWQSLYPDSEIIVVMDKPASAVFEQTEVTVIPVERLDISDYDEAVFLNVSRCCLDYEMKRDVQKSRFDIFAEHCDISVTSCGNITITDAEIRHIYDRMPILRHKSNGFKLIGVVLKSAQAWRNYPHTKLLLDYFNRLPLFDSTTRKIIPVVIDHEETIGDFTCTKDLDFRETITFISQCDMLIGPDTGPMHVASTLDIPTLWLFGPTDPRMRLRYYDNAHYIWNPCNKNHACWYDYCDQLNCLWKISPWQAARKAKGIIREHSS